MHFKRLSVFTFMVVLALVAGLVVPGSGWDGVQRAHGTTFTVTSNADSGAGTLRAAVAAAVTGDTIQFASGISSITLTSGVINISQGITITGPSTGTLTISGNNTFQIFHISGSGTMNVAINLLTLSNGKSSTFGGAVYVIGDATTVDFTSVTFANNTANYGGAVFNFGVSGTGGSVSRFYYCAFTSNSATLNGSNGGDGGAIYADSGGYVYVYNSTLNQNTAAHDGGSIYATLTGLYSTYGTFTNNTATLNGGAMYAYSSAVTLSGVSYTHNTAANGGDLYNTNTTGTVGDPGPATGAEGNSLKSAYRVPNPGVHIENSRSQGSRSQGGSTANLPMTTGPLVGSSAGYGGSIFNSATLTLQNIAIYGEFATSYGGGILNDTAGTLNLSDGDIDGNTALYGGGIFNWGTLNLSNSTVYSNTGTSGGGGIYTGLNGHTNLDSVTIALNQSTGTVSTGYDGGGGLDTPASLNGVVSMVRTLVGGNTTGTTGPDIHGAITSGGHNLVQNTAGSSGYIGTDILNQNPLLGTPGYNSPRPQTTSLLAPYTIPLLSGSPAILAGVNCFATDERFMHRKSQCDIGAYESPYTPIETVGVYSPNGQFYLKNTNAGGTQDFLFSYGAGNLIPIVGDWTGQGIKTPGLYDPSTSTFYLRNSNSAGSADITFSFGSGGTGLLPIVGDWTGQGHDGVGVYSPTQAFFYLKEALSAGTADYTLIYGPATGGFTPLAGDWSGNGFATIGLYDNNQSRFYLHGCHVTTCGGLAPADIVFQYGPAPSLGGAQAIPIMGRWVGQRQVTAGVYVPVNAYFYIKNTNAAGNADNQFQFGGAPTGWRPIFGHWANPGIHTPGGERQAFTGKLGFVSNRGGQWGIYQLTASEQNVQALTTLGSNTLDSRPAWSADGKRIAFVATKDGGSALYVMNADGSGLKRLTWNKALNYQPAWSPDGKQLVFASNLGNSTNLYLMDVDSGSVRQLTHSLSEVNEQPAWSVDGTHILYATGKGTLDLALISVDGASSQLLTKNGRQAAWSPDGKHIVFASTRDGNSQLYVMNADGSNIQRLTNNKAQDEAPTWSQDGKQIAFASTRDGNSQLYVMNADGSNIQRLTNNQAQDSFPVWLH